MYENYKQQIHGGIFIACLFFSLISPPYNQEIVQAKPKEKTSTGMASGVVQTVSNTGEVARKKEESGKLESKGKRSILNENTECGVDCKIKHLENIGIIPEIAESLVTNCKALADDPRKCVLVGASIVISESGGGRNCRKSNKYNCFGIMQNNNYKSHDDATLHFSGKFQKWWRNAESMSFFYPPAGQVSKSRFCTSEHSSNSSIGCPNGLKNSSAVFNKLSKLF